MATPCLVLPLPKWLTSFFYLRCSLSLSYSSIASYHSILSGVFRFVLPVLSFHFVLHDLLLSFRLERPLPSFRVPPWDLLRVFTFSVVLRSNLLRPVPFLTSPERCCFWCLLPLCAVLGNFKRFLVPSLLRVRISSFCISRNFVPRLSLPQIRFPTRFALAPYGILWGIFQMSSSRNKD